MNKFYEVQQLINNGHWSHVGFLKTKSEARKYMELFNTNVTVYPVKIVEREFLDVSEDSKELDL
tara:strand:+ start:88 stop:279 length:192 start_codon:yes stop_codon:yes gene_type:complete